MNAFIQIIGVGLAAGALAGLAGLVIHAARAKRGWFRRGGAARVAVRVLSIAVLLGGYAAGAEGLRLAGRTTTVAGVAETEQAVPAAVTTTSWRVPFYTQATARHTTSEGVELSRDVTHLLTLPWPFLLVVALYLLGWRALTA